MCNDVYTLERQRSGVKIVNKGLLCRVASIVSFSAKRASCWAKWSRLTQNCSWQVNMGCFATSKDATRLEAIATSSKFWWTPIACSAQTAQRLKLGAWESWICCAAVCATRRGANLMILNDFSYSTSHDFQPKWSVISNNILALGGLNCIPVPLRVHGISSRWRSLAPVMGKGPARRKTGAAPAWCFTRWVSTGGNGAA